MTTIRKAKQWNYEVPCFRSCSNSKSNKLIKLFNHTIIYWVQWTFSIQHWHKNHLQFNAPTIRPMKNRFALGSVNFQHSVLTHKNNMPQCSKNQAYKKPSYFALGSLNFQHWTQTRNEKQVTSMVLVPWCRTVKKAPSLNILLCKNSVEKVETSVIVIYLAAAFV